MYPQGGPGTIFEISTSGNERVLVNFTGNEGYFPLGKLVAFNGDLYGTTFFGGKFGRGSVCGGYGCGTAFKLSASNVFTVLHNFQYGGPWDGSNPRGGLTVFNGLLYGTTVVGGVQEQGNVFQIDPSGATTVLFDFSGIRQSPLFPAAALLPVNGELYGTTQFGGAGNCQFGCGAIFRTTPAGVHRPVYSFLGGADGQGPEAELISENGVLYGTTSEGGAYGRGTVFACTLSGTERILHSFRGGMDGADPRGGLVEINGFLYGTTAGGGAYHRGTIFAIGPNGEEHVLHNFGEGNDGTSPAATLLAVNGVLYGTTISGGSVNAGTVFELTP